MRYRLLAMAALASIWASPAFADDVHEVKCKGDRNVCLEAARRACGGDFHVLYSESHAGGLLGDAIPGPVTWYSMSYECPNSRGAAPEFPFRGNTYALPPVQDVETTTRQRVSVGSMQRFCQGEASARFGRMPHEILTLPVERDGGGYVVFGQYPPDGNRVKTFECHFDSDGSFRRVARN